MSPSVVRPVCAPPAVPDACPVCRASGPRPLVVVDCRDYWSCDNCDARFLGASHHPTRADEHRHYLNHENDPNDPRYRKFLSRLCVPLLARLAAAATGLDYGCGPGPALAAMLREAGHSVALYDPFFFPDPAPLSATYDFVTCTEVAEHFHRPADEFDRLMSLVRPGGWLAFMTCFQTDDQRFAGWHYRKDPTHVVFYRERTFRHIARMRNWICDVPSKDVALMQRPAICQEATRA